MTKKELFTCDICRTDFNSKEKAIACENSHEMAEKVKDMRFRPNENHPDKVLLKFTDGIEIWYRTYSS